MIKYIVGGVIVILAWVLSLLIDFPLWIPLLVSLVVGLAIVLIVGVEKLRERRAARELEKALAAQAEQQAATARPDLQAEIAEMQAEFAKAVAALKASKKGGKKALYALPWYAIIGPPGCGKSTALRNSGLEFPYLSASGGGVRGLGGTRNCDWWMTSDGVILDTAGRWTSEDEDHDEWVGFLDLIKRFRPKKPLNGIIAAVSVDDIGGTREEDIGALARRIRDRIDEVQDQLNMSLPVYVLFTKCDLVPGFVETFSEMRKQERGQIWGFTRPLTKRTKPPREYFLDHFDELLGVLKHRSVKRMGEDRKLSSRELIYAFPQQLEVLRDNLAEFTHLLFSENVFKETPLLRGVYFTSGTQEGRPIDRVMSKMAEAFGQQNAQLPAPQVESKSYFLRDAFAKVVFKDAAVAMRSPEEVRRQRVKTWVAAAVLFLVSLTVSGLPGIAWAGNRAFLEDTRTRIDRTHRVVAEGEADTLLPPNAIEALRVRTIELGRHQITGPPLRMRFGMYQEEVYEPVRGVYLDALRRRVVGPILRADDISMRQFAQRVRALGGSNRPEASEMSAMYESLKLHILLSLPREEHEPALDSEQREWIVTQLRRRWLERSGMERHDPQYRKMEANLQYFTDSLDSEPTMFFPRDAEAVAAVRGVFNSVGSFEMAVGGIIDRIENRYHMPDVTLRALLGRETSWLLARERVRAAFSRPAWEQHVESMLENEAEQFFGEPWVLGQELPESERARLLYTHHQVTALRTYFLRRYIDEWRNFINSIWIKAPGTDQEYVGQLTELTSGEPQLLTTLVRQVDYHVDLGGDEEGGVDLSRAGARADRLLRRRAVSRISRLGITSRTAGRLTEDAEARARQAGEDALRAPGAPVDLTAVEVQRRFAGFLAFAPPERRTSDGERPPPENSPARRYEEQLEFLRDAMRFRIAGTDVTDYDQRQGAARALTTTLIEQLDEDWRARFRTLLLPPIEGQTWEVPEPTPLIRTEQPTAPTPPTAPADARQR